MISLGAETTYRVETEFPEDSALIKFFFQTERKLNVINEFQLIINENQSIFLSKKVSLLKLANQFGDSVLLP